MQNQKHQVLQEFKKLADGVGATWNVSDNYCSFSKSGITMRVTWLVDGISGVFVTLLRDDAVNGPFKCGYGLSYLVDFRGGDKTDLAKASSDDLKSNVELARKYAVGFLDGSMRDFNGFAAFAEERIRANIEQMPPLPTIKTNKTLRAEWI